MLGFNKDEKPVDGEKTTQQEGDVGALNNVVPPSEPTPEDISKRLGGEEADRVEKEARGDAPVGEVPPPIDLSQFSPEVLQALKSMLNATPDRPDKKKDGITIKLREIDGKVVRDFSRAFNGYVTDPEEPTRKISTPKIKVYFVGQEEPVEMTYQSFMESERREFKVLNTRTEVNEVKEGETISNESGQLVTMIATYQTRYFTVEVDGKQVELKDTVANA